MALCVFCGSSKGSSPLYGEAAKSTGRALARAGVDLIYGGGHIGLMGILADAALREGGRVIGVIPAALVARELAHDGLTELHVVETMHERKAIMAELSDGFIALPGGAGTLEELFEQFTWAQLGIHAKPCGVLDVEGYFEPLRQMVERMVAEGFLHPDDARILMFRDDVDLLLTAMLECSSPGSAFRQPVGSIQP